jgi:hypothetical protein
MSFPVDIYVDSSGFACGASGTDQAYTRASTQNRTKYGRPLVYAGRWYGSQMNYRPYQNAVKAAGIRAAEKEKFGV